MGDPRHQHKVTSPALPPTHIHRAILVNQLKAILQPATAGGDESSSPYKLVLIHSPAGYGKTTLLADLAQHTDIPCCWYFLDHTDTDRLTFLSTLLASIRQRFPHFGSLLDLLLMGASSERANDPKSTNYFETVSDAFIRAMQIDIPGRFALFLCNYQEINKFSEINDIVSYFLKALPAKCTLFIESRLTPELDFAHLLSNQMVFALGTHQLRFVPQHIHELAQRQGLAPLSEQDAEYVATTFDGWIAGILLGTKLGNVQLLSGNLVENSFTSGPNSQISSQYLFSYVVNQVFKNYQTSYAFLKEASILKEMTPAICGDLLDISPCGASDHLQFLEQNGLFITHVGEGKDSVYSCMPVLQKLLYEQLRHEMPERFVQLHRRAAELLSAAQQYGQAIYHAFEGQLDDIAARLIIKSSEQMVNQGHADTLARWIDTFSTTTLERYPRLLLLRITIYLRQGNYSQALPILSELETLAQSTTRQIWSAEDQQLTTLQAEILIVRSKILFQQVEYGQSQRLCLQVLDTLPIDENALRAEAYMRLGLCYVLQGDFTAGIAQNQKALQLWGRHTVRRQTADGHSSLASVYSLIGNFALAQHHISRSLACWNQLQDMWGKIETLVSLAHIRLRQGAVQEAEAAAQEALMLAKGPLRFLRGQAYALVCLGEIYISLERYEQALEPTDEALMLARQMNDLYLINGILCNLALIYLYMRDMTTAILLISEVEVESASGEKVGYKYAIRDLVYGTVHLYQGKYTQAWPYLSSSCKVLGEMGLKQEHLQALLRLAAYHLAQKQLTEVTRLVQETAAITTICEGYERLAQREIRHLPDLQHAIQTLAPLAQIRNQLHLEVKVLETPVQEISLSPPPEPVSSPPAVEVYSHQLTIVALGEPAVYIQQSLVSHWRMARALELFLYLLNEGRPVRKEAIISALWPEMNEHTTRTFYSTIYYLRQALGGEAAITTKGGRYTLTLNTLYNNDVWYDVAAFKNHHASAKQALNDEEDEIAKNSLLAMIDLYRGDYVQPFYSDWCTMQRDELRTTYLTTRHQLALIYWRVEEFDEAISHWQHMLAVDNCREEAHYGLMRCYARQGKRGLALRQYQRCKDIMEQEFGTAPKSSIQNLYQRLLSQSS
ncbi:MAG TPA: BTAD domain-containing putative transcriptional regulator [Ktedonobacteraceae bacterium]